MDVILSHFSASELRLKCLKAVEDELTHAEQQLRPSLVALKRALSVVQASRSMSRAPLVLVDESPGVANALTQLAAACNDVGALICEINRQVSSSDSGDASPLAADDEREEQVKAEPKRATTEHKEKKKAAKDTARRRRRRVGVGSIENSVEAAPDVVDLSLSDDEKERSEVVKEEKKTVENDEVTVVKEEIGRESTVRVAVVELENAPAEEKDGVETSFPDPEVEVPMEEEGDEVRVPTRRINTQKRRATKRLAVAPPPKRAMRDVVIRLRRRAEMVPSGDVGAAVCSALNGAIAVEILPDTRGIGPFVRAFLSATTEAGQKLVEVHAQHPVQAERHLEDMRLLMSVALANLERGLSREEVCAAWKMFKVLQQLHDLYPAKTKGLHRSCLQLYNCLVKMHAVPSDVVTDFQMKLEKVLEEVDEWSPLDGLNTKWFDQQMSLVTELLEGQFEHWNPRDEPVLGKVVANLERICTFGVDDEWNDRYASICMACSKMSRSTFFWTFDLAEDMTNKLIRCDELEAGFEDRNRVKNDFEYVTSYNEEVRQVGDAVKKKEAFDELIDRLRWIFNAVAMTKKQSLLPLAQLKELNKCLATLVDLCDNGDALNLEGCLHLEKLLAVMRQVMYARIDYAKVSVGYVLRCSKSRCP